MACITSDLFSGGFPTDAYIKGNWPMPEGHDDPVHRRCFARFPNVSTLPTADDLALGEIFYDTPDYNSNPYTVGFRNRIEGWVT